MSKRSQTQNNDDDDDDICSSVEDTEAAVYHCLQQYIQHYINVCVASVLCFFLSHFVYTVGFLPQNVAGENDL